MKRVLIISYAFPPWACAGVHRPLRFAKNLPRDGWLPVVLTAKGNLHADRDEALCEEIPAEVEIHGAAGVDPYGWLTAALRTLSLRRPIPAALSVAQGTAGDGSPPPPSPPSTRCLRQLRALKDLCLAALSTPDRRLFWVPFAIAAGARILRRQPADAILVTTPPHSVQLAGLALSALFGIPWVADLRDAWLDNPHLQARTRSRLRLRIEGLLERLVVSRAALVFVVSSFWRERLIARYPDRADRVVLLPNGYDGDLFAREGKGEGNGVFTLAHFGSLYYGRKAEEVLRGMRAWIDRFGDGDPGRARFVLAGSDIPSLAPRVAELGLEGSVELQGLIPHAEAVRRMRESSALLLVSDFSPCSEGMVPCKLFEYLASGRPILALAPEGDATRLVREARAGVIVTDPDPIAIARGIEEVRALAAARWRPADPGFLAAYEGRRLSGELARILDGLCP